jgi:exopolyphosphatase/guanosine-5'-triphosphate,3'-diphosphate pyrophosphatase
MDRGARETGGLDPTRDRSRSDGVRRDRRWPNGKPHREGAAVDTVAADRGGATYAALDLGTNNCRLLVARPAGHSFRVIDAFSRIIRLGEGVSGSGMLSEAAVARAIDALGVCRDKMRNRGVTRARLIATEACRAAGNGAAFQQEVRDKLGLDLEIIGRDTEAALAATGCTPLIDRDARGVILFDIGGGSSELVRLGQSEPVRHGPPKPAIEAWASLPVGVVTLAERHGGHHITRELYETMVQEVSGLMAPFVETAGGNLDGIHMLGTSGTVTTVAGVHLDLPRYDRRRVDGLWMDNDEITRVVDLLMDMTYEQRAANPCIGNERADLVLAGCAILEAIRRAFPCPRLRVADRGLREGILVELMRADGAWGN